MKTTVVVPTYNEKDNIIPLTEQILNILPQTNILIVDDNSPDGTGRIADQLAQKNPQIKVLHRQKKEGLGRAYIEAFKSLLAGDSDYIITMDADFSHDPKYLIDLLEAMKNADVAIGSRYVHGVSVLNWSLSRLILSVLANKYIKITSGLSVNDCTSGFVCYRKHILGQVDFKNFSASGYAFLFELKYRLFERGFNLKEVPIIFTERRTGSPKMSRRVILEAFFTALRLRFQKDT